MPEPGLDFMERLNPISRAHFREARPDRMLSPVSGESQVRQKWSVDVAKRAVEGALGREIKKPEELDAALTEIKSDALRRFVRASTLLADAEIEGDSGKQVLLQRSARLREIQEEEDLEGNDLKIARAISEAVGRKIRGLTNGGKVVESLTSRADLIAGSTGKEWLTDKLAGLDLKKIDPWLWNTIIARILRDEADVLSEKDYLDLYSALESRRTTVKIDEKQADLVKNILTEKIEEKGEKLPKDVERQRAFIRLYLERIERGRYPLGEGPNSEDYKKLQAAEKELHPSVAAELQARLRLHDSYIYIAVIAGGTKDMIEAYRRAGTVLAARGHLIEGEDLQLLLKDGLKELRIRGAFDEIQRTKYEDTLPGTPGRLKLEKRYGETSVRLALSLGAVLFESSVWNKNIIGNDALAEGIYLKKYRTDRNVKGRDSGPESTREVIDCVCTSFLRHVVIFKQANNSLTGELPRMFEEFRRTKDQTLRRRILERVISIRREEPLDLDKINFKKLNPGEFGVWLAATLPYMLSAKELILKEDWKPDEISMGEVEKWVHWFNSAADPDGYLALKPYFAMGVIDQGLTSGIPLGWGSAEPLEAMKVFTTPTGKEADNKPVSFLDREQAEWVGGVLKIGRRGFWNEFVIAMRDAHRWRRR